MITISKKFKKIGAPGIIIACSTLAAFQILDGADPIQPKVFNPSGTAAEQGVIGEIIPLIWHAQVGNALTSVPLSSIDHYGVQDYLLQGVASVRELTITTKSQSMIRIYHVKPIIDIVGAANERLEELRKKITNGDDEDKDLPAKDYPTTTHKKMVEYRVSEVKDIDVLFNSLDETMITFLGRQLPPGQREQIVNKVKVKPH